MSEVEWRGRTVPVKNDKARIFLLGLADNEAAIAQVRTNELVHTQCYFTAAKLILIFPNDKPTSGLACLIRARE